MYKYGVAIIFYNPNISDIERAKTYTKTFNNILIIDNSDIEYYSENKYIEEKLENIKANPIFIYHSMGGNLGISQALNYAYSWAKKNELDYLLTMDQDTDYEIKEIKKMKRYINSRQKGLIAVYTSNWRKIYLDKYNSEVYGKWKHSRRKVVLTNRAMTSGSFYDVDIIQKYLPLKDLFIGFVDDDISYALLNDGFKVATVGFSGISQHIGKTIKNSLYNIIFRKVILQPSRYYYMARNSAYLKDKYKKNSLIIKNIKIIRMRILMNIILCEENKIEKWNEWKKGNKTRITG